MPSTTELDMLVDIPKLPLDFDESRSDGPRQRRALTRREVMRKLFSGACGALALPRPAQGHPISRYLSSEMIAIQAQEKAAATDWHPEFLNPAQDQALVAIAEGIVPGSSGAQVNRILDLLLTLETDAKRKDFISSLTVFNRISQKKYGQAFAFLTSNQRDEVLAACSTGEESPAPPGPADPDETSPRKSPVTDRDHFENLKSWIVETYYATEQGMRELGWTEEFYFDELPGREHEGEQGKQIDRG